MASNVEDSLSHTAGSQDTSGSAVESSEPAIATQLADLQDEIRNFCEVRDWDQFHHVKDLAIGLVTESAELLDLFRFKSNDECAAMLEFAGSREKIEDELADVFFFVLRFAQRNQIDLPKALRNKIVKNAQKYPVELSRGLNKKYDEL